MNQPILASALIELFHDGGPIMYPIAIVTFIGIAIIIERLWWWFHHARSCRPAERLKVFAALEQGRMEQAEKMSANSPDAVLRVVNAGLTHRHGSLHGALQAAAGIEIKQAGRFLTAMDTIITLGPLLGLLGTVTGIMGSFGAVGSTELAVEKVTGGIGEALIATAFGLGIAIATLIPYNWFHAKIATLQHDIETAASNVEVFTSAPPSPVHV